jgi:hypothetical protein
MDPNSTNQLWSEWTFDIWDSGKHPPFKEVEYNARKWLRAGFGSVAQARVEEKVNRWTIVARVEGVPAHDPSYQTSVRRQFQKNFVEPGWGVLGVSSVSVRVLAGDIQDGSPRSQLVVLPTIDNVPPGTIRLPLHELEKRWKTKPSMQLCAKECEAKCCKGTKVELRPKEYVELSKRTDKTLDISWDQATGLYMWRLGEKCAFLTDANACSIYANRPEGCRLFPSKPYDFCGVWPSLRSSRVK